MNITRHNIDSPSCTVCKRHRPWTTTIARLKSELQARNVSWPSFVLMHGKGRSCEDAASRLHDRGLYVVAVNASGQVDRRAVIFARKAPYYVGINAILTNRAF